MARLAATTPRGVKTLRLSATARRVSPLPGDWRQRVTAVKTRDGHQCTWVERGIRCPETTHLEVDHIGDDQDHDLDNLRLLCNHHHASKTGRDANAIRWARARAKPAPKRHPGLVA